MAKVHKDQGVVVMVTVGYYLIVVLDLFLAFSGTPLQGLLNFVAIGRNLGI